MSNELHPHAAQEQFKQGQLRLIDVRTPAEFEDVHAVGAINLPLDRLTRESLSAALNGCRPGFICRSGGRGKQALERAKEWGIDGVNVSGGTTAWESTGCEVVRGQPTMSLERQVRIAAGALVATGTLSGLLFSPWFFAVPLFVGCGLVFAGVTDTCAMGLLIARMPWNQNGCSTQCGVVQQESK